MNKILDVFKIYDIKTLEKYRDFHEKEARSAMNNLSCGSDNWEYKYAHSIADAHIFASTMINLYLESLKPALTDLDIINYY